MNLFVIFHTNTDDATYKFNLFSQLSCAANDLYNPQHQ